MLASATVCLMYHELELPCRNLCQAGEGYRRYIVSEADFRAQVRRLQTLGWHGTSLGEWVDGGGRRPGVVITFDDGCETDRIAAAPILAAAGFGATFYVVVGFLGRRGYLSPAQLRELADAGFEIGCHSMTHAFLPELNWTALHTEVAEAKLRLEELLGREVHHLSCPGGRWSPRVAEMAQAAGFHSVSTSRIEKNSGATDAFCLARVAMLRGTTLDQFDALCRGEGLIPRRAREAVLGAAKSLLGNVIYEKVRAAVLDRG